MVESSDKPLQSQFRNTEKHLVYTGKPEIYPGFIPAQADLIEAGKSELQYHFMSHIYHAKE